MYLHLSHTLGSVNEVRNEVDLETIAQEEIEEADSNTLETYSL